MASTSINIQPCKIGSSEEHNYRLKALDYVRSELSYKNESWQSDDRTLIQHLDAVRSLVKEKTGRKLQDKATPIREGVIVIREDTTLEELKRFADICQERWGIKPLQIHTHKDEGHMNAKEWKPNLHAHIVFLWVDETTGKSIKLNSQHMAEMQTLLAETLEMERGVSSDKKHLSSLQFKTEAEIKKLGDIEILKTEIKNAVEAQIKPIETLLIESTSKSIFGGVKTDYEAVVAKIQDQEKQRAIVKVSEKTFNEIKLQDRIRELEERLRQSKRETEQAKDVLADMKSDLSLLARFLRGYLRDGFEEFKDECQDYFLRKFNKVLELSAMVLMWAGKVVRDNLGNKYSADYENARLLINGKTIEQYEAKEQESRMMKEQEGKTNSIKR